MTVLAGVVVGIRTEVVGATNSGPVWISTVVGNRNKTKRRRRRRRRQRMMMTTTTRKGDRHIDRHTDRHRHTDRQRHADIEAKKLQRAEGTTWSENHA